MAVQVFVALGANLVQPAKQMRRAIALICLLPQTRLLKSSSFYCTSPIGYTDQPDFTNSVVEISTELTARELLEALLAIESALGRERSIPNGPRTIDLDLILYGDRTIDEKDLIVPHPRMHERAFVLVPLTEIAPDIVIPSLGPAKNLLATITDQSLKRLPL
ncbi:MAG: 2-amino-4-hydroxy-6-hydroxymethyldihydropteridine diphosphokinase [Formivibrio sp.]|nr:2-amino-4-hydroxy-6-hydroxymethyldihydropteridine diphosphokinase [Formivibrio sp.]